MSGRVHQRGSVAMTPAEVDELLHGRRTMSLATIRADGRPHLVAMWYGFIDGDPSFLTYRGSQKYRNLERDPRVTCLVEDGESYDELRGVQLFGRAEVVTDEAGRMAIACSVTERYQGPLDEAGRAAVGAGIVKRVAFRVRVDEVVSWDHRKLAAAGRQT